jgi:hypothetical protein
MGYSYLLDVKELAQKIVTCGSYTASPHGDHRTPVTKRKKKLERYEPYGKPIKKMVSTVIYKGVNYHFYKCYWE